MDELKEEICELLFKIADYNKVGRSGEHTLHEREFDNFAEEMLAKFEQRQESRPHETLVSPLIDDREIEIQKLCEGVKEVILDCSNDLNGCYDYTCPLCWNTETIGGRETRPTMDTFEHDKDCPYLIAKDLSTKAG